MRKRPLMEARGRAWDRELSTLSCRRLYPVSFVISPVNAIISEEPSTGPFAVSRRRIVCRTIKLRRRLSVSLLLLCAAPLLIGQEPAGGLGVQLAPAVHIPTESYLGIGYAMRASAMYRFSGLPLYAELAAGMSQTNSTGIPTEAAVRWAVA